MERNRRVFYKDVILKNNNTKELVKLFSLYLPVNDTINNVLDYFNIDRLYENVTNYSVFDKRSQHRICLRDYRPGLHHGLRHCQNAELRPW